MNEESEKTLLDYQDSHSDESPYPIPWEIFEDDKLAYSNLLKYADISEYTSTTELWSDYGEFLSIQKRYLDYAKHVLLEKESYASFIDILQDAMSNEDMKNIIFGCQVMATGATYWCLNSDLGGTHVFVAMFSIGLVIGLSALAKIYIQLVRLEFQKQRYLEYEAKNLKKSKLEDSSSLPEVESQNETRLSCSANSNL